MFDQNLLGLLSCFAGLVVLAVMLFVFDKITLPKAHYVFNWEKLLLALQKYGCKEEWVYPYVATKQGDYRYHLRITAGTSDGKEIIFMNEPFDIDNDDLFPEEKMEGVTRLLSIAEEKTKKLAELFPSASVELRDSNLRGFLPPTPAVLISR